MYGEYVRSPQTIAIKDTGPLRRYAVTMATPYTRIHRHLGLPPGPLNFDNVKQAADSGLEESEELDWKAKLPPTSAKTDWSEFVKDVVAFANNAGGLLVYGVTDDLKVVGINPATASDASQRTMEQMLRSRVSPSIEGVLFSRVASTDAGQTLLLVHVPSSEFAPHLIYTTVGKEKEQRATVTPQRVGRDTVWMEEHQLARAYRERFGRQQIHANKLDELLRFTAEQCVQDDRREAWLIFAATPVREVRGHPTIERHSVLDIALDGLRGGLELKKVLSQPVELLRSLDAAGQNPRTGYKRWVLSNFLSSADTNANRPVYVELHHDGSCTLGANLSWGLNGDPDSETVPLLSGAIEAAAADFTALTQAMSRAVLNQAPISMNVQLHGPASTNTRFTLMSETPQGAVIERGYLRRLRRAQTVAIELRRPDNLDEQRNAAYELSSGILNQFGMESLLPRPILD